AQKTGNAIISDSKEKAANIVQEAENKSAEMMKDADDYVAERKEEGEKIISDALAEKARIEEEARKAAEDIHTQMEIQTEIDKEILARTKREAEDFRTRIIVEDQNHIDIIKKIPEDCFNEFVVETTTDHSSVYLRELIASQNGVQAPEIPEPDDSPEEKSANTDEDVKIVDSFSDIETSDSGSEDETDDDTVEDADYDEADGADFTVGNAFGEDFSDSDDDDDDGAPDFLSSRPNRNSGSKYDKLEFGINNTSNNNRGSHNNNHRNKKRK
ncbi:MAG: hypothetical protein J6X60_00200, partial [Ruminiclostridium sp.]|nr:hypothetical protein [Ruminiclostridium sp.]